MGFTLGFAAKQNHFIKPIFDTLDLYQNQGFDPRAIAISFKQQGERTGFLKPLLGKDLDEKIG
ncbi:hypothetical protein FD724_31875 (plasmid) [Nostoc sp. C057]|uniref:hypothetical protein n=1 Tax=Nostoc sp. C057 TaxID=2576903 RepID=UPI0015C325F1|nr:hypothetical protein [Nostoc sp. C057]QLE52601.1 hypothetical protein FD724_31875 [Nostoc sp. C057]